jgi:hypothetical protein
MLTVIGIIVLLVSILLPVVSAVRVKGHQADTMAMLARIGAGAESYNADHRSYPGPLSNMQIHNAAAGTMAMKTGGNIQFSKVTQAENFAIGLLGGLYAESTGGGAVEIKFDPDLVGNGPNSLNPRSPKKGRAYMDKVSLTDRNPDPAKLWDYRDDADDADDSQLPEFLDKFPDPMPILVLRAKAGAGGVATNTTNYAMQQQYDLNQIIGYTGKMIGIGKEKPADDEFKPSVPSDTDKYKHGLRTVDPNSQIVDENKPGYKYPYDLYGFMRHPSMAGTPRQKDGYILISAGADRIYGTKDDAVYPTSR